MGSIAAGAVSACAFAYSAFVGNPHFFDAHVSSTIHALEVLAHVLPVAGGILGVQVRPWCV